MSQPPDKEGKLYSLDEMRLRKKTTKVGGEIQPDRFTDGVIQIEGSDIYDENHIIYGGMRFTDYRAQMQAESQLGIVAQIGLVAAEKFILNARARYLQTTLNDPQKRANAYVQLAEYTWDRALEYQSEELRAEVGTFVTQVFTTHQAGSLLEKLSQRTILTQTPQVNQAASKIHQFRPRNKPS